MRLAESIGKVTKCLDDYWGVEARMFAADGIGELINFYWQIRVLWRCRDQTRFPLPACTHDSVQTARLTDDLREQLLQSDITFPAFLVATPDSRTFAERARARRTNGETIETTERVNRHVLVSLRRVIVGNTAR